MNKIIPNFLSLNEKSDHFKKIYKIFFEHIKNAIKYDEHLGKKATIHL